MEMILVDVRGEGKEGHQRGFTNVMKEDLKIRVEDALKGEDIS